VFDRAANGNTVSPMGPRAVAVLVTIGFSVLGVAGDYFLKLASESDHPLRSRCSVNRATRQQTQRRPATLNCRRAGAMLAA